MIFLESIDDDNPPPYIAPPTVVERREALPPAPARDESEAAAWWCEAGQPPRTAYVTAQFNAFVDPADVRIWCLTVRLAANQCCRASYDEADAITVIHSDYSDADEATIRALVYEEYDAVHAEEQAFWDAVEADAHDD